MALLNFDESGKVAERKAKQVSDVESTILHEEQFEHRLAYERKRSERSHQPLLLVLVETCASQEVEQVTHELSQVVSALTPKLRETDTMGWHREHKAIGIILTELSMGDKNAILSTVFKKFSTALQSELSATQFSQLSVSFHFFPDDWREGDPTGGSNDPTLYPDVTTIVEGRRISLGIKRFIDISLSLLLLLMSLPLFLIIAVAIKTTSKGPVFFIQQRVGQYGRRFKFLKFRSMTVNNDCRAHREYVSALIAGKPVYIDARQSSTGVYKLANDHRITSVGKFLRRTSLDELPQLINILCGQMSLVGPRPPIPYELAAYQVWHRRRLLEVKPGLTGLWQVKGRSHVSFDDMVRLDLQYVKTWSLWLDLKILLQTPRAVFRGAY